MAGRERAGRATPPDVRPVGTVDARTRVRIARRYFLEQRTKVQIADEFGLTRFQVARIVQDSLDDGTVTITIRGAEHLDDDLAAQLCKRFGLADAMVVDDLEQTPGEYVTAMIEPSLGDDAIFAVDWNPAVGAVTSGITTLPESDVVQARGVAGLGDHAVETVTRLARVCRGNAFPIFAPFLSRVAADAQTLRNHPLVEIATDRFDRLDCVVLGVSAVEDAAAVAWSGVADADREALRDAGAVASLGASLLDAAGGEVTHPITERWIGLSRAQLSRIPLVLLVDAGAQKATALRAALAGGLVHQVITDSTTAKAVLAGL